MTLKAHECGYFAFLPIVREVCGTHTWGNTHNSVRKDCGDEFHTITNACSSELHRADIDKSAGAWGAGHTLKGDTIFALGQLRGPFIPPNGQAESSLSSSRCCNASSNPPRIHVVLEAVAFVQEVLCCTSILIRTLLQRCMTTALSLGSDRLLPLHSSIFGALVQHFDYGTPDFNIIDAPPSVAGLWTVG